jgi:hypothetical protein
MEIKDFYAGADQSLFSSIISRHLTNICDKYKIGSYLECVNPMNSNEICIGQIKLRVKHLLFIRIYSSSSSSSSLTSNDIHLNVFTQNSFDLFPVGWCEMNNYKNFLLPNHFKNKINQNEVYRSDLAKVPYLARFNGNYFYLNVIILSNNLLLIIDPDLWSDFIYLNTNYNCGPYLSRSKLIKLPKRIGPGPIVLVISTVFSQYFLSFLFFFNFD